jgi:hypothetical protein
MPLTWRSLFHTLEGAAALAAFFAAGATIFLASITAWLAHRVKQQSDAARDEVEVSRKALQTSVQPILTDVPFGVFIYRPENPLIPGSVFDQAAIVVAEQDGGMRLSVPARNVGAGLALVPEVMLRWQASPPPAELAWLPGVATTRAVPPGELTEAIFVLKQEYKTLSNPSSAPAGVRWTSPTRTRRASSLSARPYTSASTNPASSIRGG